MKTPYARPAHASSYFSGGGSLPLSPRAAAGYPLSVSVGSEPLVFSLMSNYNTRMANRDTSGAILSVMSKKLHASYGFIRRRMAESGLEGLDVSHGDILWQLLGGEAKTMSELALGIGRDKSTVTALVNKMERRGLVKKTRDRSDSRVTFVELTDRGASYKSAFLSISEEIRTILWEGFSDIEKETLMGLIARLGEPN